MPKAARYQISRSEAHRLNHPHGENLGLTNPEARAWDAYPAPAREPDKKIGARRKP